MLEDWKTYKLDEICDLIVDCPHSTPKWRDYGTTVLRSNNIRNGKLNFDKQSYTDEDHYRQRIKRAIPQGGDLVITREAPMGEVCMLPQGLKCCLGQRMVLIRPSVKVNNIYLLYAIQAKEVQNQIMIYEGTGSTVSNLRIPVLESLKIPYPPLPEQRAIASVLSALDDKIELNLQMNKTLEEMAMTLYKHWFVDFGPFKDGNFIDSELGMIPEGWEVKSVYDLANYVNGAAFKSTDFEEDGLYVIKIAELKNGITSNTKKSRKIIRDELYINNGSVLFSWSASLDVFLWDKGNALLNQHIFNVIPNGSLPIELLYFMLKNIIAYFQAIAADRATTMGHIKLSHLKETLIAVPKQEKLPVLGNAFESLFKQIMNNLTETQTLIATRDTLLPKLISGEVRVKEAEQTLAQVL